MDILVSNTSDTPIYQQIYEQLRSQILAGTLKSDACLPPIRTAAAELRVSVITVKKAYEALEREGLLYAVTGRGTFVAPLRAAEREDRRARLAEEALARELSRCKALGLGKAEALALVERLYGY